MSLYVLVAFLSDKIPAKTHNTKKKRFSSAHGSRDLVLSSLAPRPDGLVKGPGGGNPLPSWHPGSGKGRPRSEVCRQVTAADTPPFQAAPCGCEHMFSPEPIHE